MYLKGLEYYRCVKDGHHIEEPFWEKCDKYKRDYGKKVRKRSSIYEVIKKMPRSTNLHHGNTD